MPYVSASYLNPADYVSSKTVQFMSASSSTLTFLNEGIKTKKKVLCQLDPRKYYLIDFDLP